MCLGKNFQLPVHVCFYDCRPCLCALPVPPIPCLFYMCSYVYACAQRPDLPCTSVALRLPRMPRPSRLSRRLRATLAAVPVLFAHTFGPYHIETTFRIVCNAYAQRLFVCPAAATAPASCKFHIMAFAGSACAAGSDLFCACNSLSTCFPLAAEACGAVVRSNSAVVPAIAAVGRPPAPAAMLTNVCTPCGYWPPTADRSDNYNFGGPLGYMELESGYNQLNTNGVCVSSAVSFWNATCAAGTPVQQRELLACQCVKQDFLALPLTTTVQVMTECLHAFFGTCNVCIWFRLCCAVLCVCVCVCVLCVCVCFYVPWIVRYVFECNWYA